MAGPHAHVLLLKRQQHRHLNDPITPVLQTQAAQKLNDQLIDDGKISNIVMSSGPE
jgi:hypothetical protein